MIKENLKRLTMVVSITAVVAGIGIQTGLAEDQPTNGEVIDAVEVELWQDSAVVANQIDVSAADGIVTLTGTVNNILAKDRARELAAATVGVRSIINRIKVVPQKTRSDKDLAGAVNAAWDADPATEASELEAVADNGKVTITGTVGSYIEKDLAAQVAKAVSGVKEISNEIDIEYKETRADEEIREEVAKRLENDVQVDDKLIMVSVDDGRVTLEGTVGSAQEKTQADIDGWVAGVKDVNTEELEVNSEFRDSMRRSNLYFSRSDEEIRDAVESSFVYDPRVHMFEIDVAVSNGTVTLSGTVENAAAKTAAEQDARNTLGVRKVKNRIKVVAEPLAQKKLEERVAKALKNDPYIERYAIEIDAFSGWVTLSGKVNTSFERKRARNVASKTQGLLGVINNITYDYVWTRKPDWEIKEDVQEQLKWSAFVDEDDISVSVQDGVVTLRGDVYSWSEFLDAEKNAYQGGAKDVRNELEIKYQYYGPHGPLYFGSPRVDIVKK